MRCMYSAHRETVRNIDRWSEIQIVRQNRTCIGRQKEIKIGRKTQDKYRQTDKETVKHTDWQTNTGQVQVDRKRGRQKYRLAEKHRTSIGRQIERTSEIQIVRQTQDKYRQTNREPSEIKKGRQKHEKYRQTDRETVRNTDCQTNTGQVQVDRQRERQKNRLSDKHRTCIGRQIERPSDIKTGKQTQEGTGQTGTQLDRVEYISVH